MIQEVDRRLIRERAQDRAPDITRKLLSEKEDEAAEQEKRDDREAEALEKEAGDDDRPLSGAGGVRKLHRRRPAAL